MKKIVFISLPTPCISDLRGKCLICQKEKLGNNSYCQTHSCGFKLCQKPRYETQSVKSKFCETRTYRSYPTIWTQVADARIDTCDLMSSTSDICRHPVASYRSAKSKFCYIHECGASSCHNKSKLFKGGFCKEEHSCLASKCSKRRVGTHYCTDHECVIQDCHHQKQEHSGLCQEKHACKAKSCSTQRCPKTDYCEKHTCHEIECPDEASHVDGFCQKHRCLKPACRYRRVTSPLSQFCKEHKCKEDDCGLESPNPDGYCTGLHACRWTTCMERRSPSPAETLFCTTHKCQKSDCRYESKVPGGHCNTHACPRDGCGALRGKPSDHRNPGELCHDHQVDEIWEEKEEKRDRPAQQSEEEGILTQSADTGRSYASHGAFFEGTAILKKIWMEDTPGVLSPFSVQMVPSKDSRRARFS